jgi:hypothetical protein
MLLAANGIAHEPRDLDTALTAWELNTLLASHAPAPGARQPAGRGLGRRPTGELPAGDGARLHHRPRAQHRTVPGRRRDQLPVTEVAVAVIRLLGQE